MVFNWGRSREVFPGVTREEASRDGDKALAMGKGTALPVDYSAVTTRVQMDRDDAALGEEMSNLVHGRGKRQRRVAL